MKKASEKDIWRIIDANFNRSREGLRVCEDISRFILNSGSITAELKSARHEISGILKGLPRELEILSGSRDSKNDILREERAASEMRRKDASDIFRANMERVKESLRVLEEFFKLLDAKRSARFSALRFKAYDIEKKAAKRLKMRDFSI